MTTTPQTKEENKNYPIEKAYPENPQEIKLPGEIVHIGAGTVPTSTTSSSTTSIQEVVKSFRKISDLGIFDAVDKEDENRSTSPAK